MLQLRGNCISNYTACSNKSLSTGTNVSLMKFSYEIFPKNFHFAECGGYIFGGYIHSFSLCVAIRISGYLADFNNRFFYELGRGAVTSNKTFAVTSENI